MRKALRRLRRRTTADLPMPAGHPTGDWTIDADAEEPETGPFRRCAVTRERAPKERMFRFVVSPDRVLIPDLAGKLPGRGIWLSAAGYVLEGADRQAQDGALGGKRGAGAREKDLIRAFARAARGPVQVPSGLSGVLENGLIRRIGDLLGLARRAGQAIAGFEKARDWMKHHPTGLILQARDGSEAERSRFRSGVAETLPILDPLNGAEMGRVFGHENVVHVVVGRGRLADTIIIEAGRLAGLRTPPVPAVVTGKARRATAGINDATGTDG